MINFNPTGLVGTRIILFNITSEVICIMTHHSQHVTPQIENAICTWYTKSYGPHGVPVVLLNEMPDRHPEPGHIFFDHDATVQLIGDKPVFQPLILPPEGSGQTLALVVRRWRRNMSDNGCIVGMSWYQ